MRCHLNVMYFVTQVAAMNVPGICVPDGWLKSHLEQFNVTAVMNDYVEMWMTDVCVCVCVFTSLYVICNI